MPIEAIVSGVAFAAGEPAAIESGFLIEHLVERLVPMDIGRGLPPERLGVPLPALIGLVVTTHLRFTSPRLFA
jgi:hypothetical protein